MNLIIEARATPLKPDPHIVSNLLQHLSSNGYEPLLSKAKRRFLEVFGVSSAPTTSTENLSPEAWLETAYRKAWVGRYGARDVSKIPLLGDLFYPSNSKGLVYVALTFAGPGSASKRSRSALFDTELEVGFIGDESERRCLEEVSTNITEFLHSLGVDAKWVGVPTFCPPFAELQSQSAKFALASSVTDEELELSKHLEDSTTRNLALVIKRSGGILASDVTKRAELKPEQAQRSLDRLRGVQLLGQEYVVICRKTSNQVNRVDSRSKIDSMTEMGVLCSCGSPIGQERIEELVSPTPTLHRLLNQSYWMTAKLVGLLRTLNVPNERILLNLQEGAEEIDAFVDLEGTLLMFELKDNEFSMGHAYPFGGRIGLYKPDVAVIVSTKGVAPEVLEYFKRVKPQAEISYVNSMGEFEENLRTLITRTRAARAYDMISQFEQIAAIDVPVAQLIISRLGVGALPRRRSREE